MRNQVLLFFAHAPPSVGDLLLRALAPAGYAGRWAANEREMLTLAQNQRSGLLLLDFNWPLRRTLNALEQLQAVNAFVPVILITEQRIRFERAVAGRVAALIHKPFAVSLLLRTMGAVLNPLSEAAQPGVVTPPAQIPSP